MAAKIGNNQIQPDTRNFREKILLEYEKTRRYFVTKDTSDLKELLSNKEKDIYQLKKFIDVELIPEMNKFTKIQLNGGNTLNYETNDFNKFVSFKIEEFNKDDEVTRKIISTCKKPLVRNPNDTFSKIAGMTWEKKDLEVQFIYPEIYTSLFRSSDKTGILLYGPPGTGKTYLAKIAASVLDNIAYFAPQSGDLEGKYVGESQKLIEKLFTCASNYIKENKEIDRSIIFFDEFDSIAKKRSSNPGADRTVNSLLQMMDGISSKNNVSVIASTNLLKEIDDAILSRFPIKIFVDLPENITREFIIRNELYNFYRLPLKKGEEEEIKEDFNSNNMRNTKFYQNGLIYGIIYSDVDSSGLIRTKRTTSDLNVARSDEIIDEFVKKLGPKKESSSVIKSQGRRTRDDEFSEKAVSKWGYSSRDIVMLMKSVIKIASLRAIDTDAEYIEQELNEKKYLVYVPGEKSDKKEDISIPDIFKKKKRIMFSSLSSEDKKRIISFDIRKSDFDDAIKRVKTSINNYTDYIIPGDDDNGDTET